MLQKFALSFSVLQYTSEILNYYQYISEVTTIIMEEQFDDAQSKNFVCIFSLLVFCQKFCIHINTNTVKDNPCMKRIFNHQGWNR
jgi:hypothetical protein